MQRSESLPIRCRLAAEGWAQQGERFEVLAISAGEGNGWHFGEAVLQASLPLWEGVPCFVDHAREAPRRSVRDLAGIFRRARWSPAHRGVLVELEAFGPSAELLTALGRQVLQQAEVEQAAPQVGFSADVLFTAQGREVQRILRVVELDLVVRPARGGAFLRTLPQATSEAQATAFQAQNAKPSFPLTLNETGDRNMTETNGTPETQAAAVAHHAQMQRGDPTEPLRPQSPSLDETLEQVAQARLQICQHLLEAELAASGLPLAMAEHVRRQFDGRVYAPSELSTAIEAARRLVSDLLGASVVRGPSGRISQVFSTEDQLQAAVDDLLQAPREKGCEHLQVHRLSGIRELYLMLTGDSNLYGGYYPERVQLATTANFAGLVKNALNKIVANQWEQLGAAGYDWWQRVTLQEHFESLNTVTGILVGTVGSLPEVAEGAEYTELKVGDSPETADFTKYGGYIPLTLELIDRDDTRKLRLYPRELAKAGIRRISALVAEVFTANSGVGPLMADGGYLFNATAVTTAGGHANLRTAALSSAEWENVCAAVYSQPMLIANESGYYGTGPALAINPRYLLVPRALELTAKKILYPYWENAANIHSENLQRGAMGDVVVVPEWTDANNWAAAVDPNLVPGIIVCERFGILPEIFIAGDELSPAVFMNDEHRIKVRHFIAVLVQDWRPLHKSNVA